MGTRMRFMGGCMLFGALLASCQSLGPPPARLKPLLTNDTPQAVRHQGRVEIRSEWFGGEFKVLAVEQGGDEALIRFQLIPDFGGKVLDLVASPDKVLAVWPHDGKLERKRSGLIGFLAVSLVEQATPITWERVLSGKQTATGFLVELEPASRGLDLELQVELSATGELLARHYELGLVQWSEVFEPQHAIQASDFDWIFLEQSSETIASPPDALFVIRAAEQDAP